MQAIPVSLQHLRAVSLFSAVKDIGSYLNGVYCEVTDSAVRLVATDGRTLALTHTPHASDDEKPTPCSFIIPSDTVKQVLKAAGKHDGTAFISPPDGVWIVPNEKPFTVKVGNTALYFTPIDGKFPDYRRVIPKTCDGTAAQFDPDLLVRFKRAAECYRSKHGKAVIGIEMNGNGPALIHGIDADFIGVVMTWTKLPEDKGVPAWFDESAPAPMEQVA